jgi:hypothetical protein
MIDGARLARLQEQIAHARRADADDHLDELGRGEAEERHARFPGDRPREQRLAGARRADQQHALRHGAAEPLVLRGVLQEVDDLDQLVLGLVDAGDVGESDLRLGPGVTLGAALPEPEHAGGPAPRRRASRERHEGGNQQQRRPEADQQLEPRRPALVARVDDDTLALEQRLESRVRERRALGLKLLGDLRRREAIREPLRSRRLVGRGLLLERIAELRLQRTANGVANAGHAHDVAGVDLLLEHGVGNRDRARLGRAGSHQQVVGRDHEQHDRPPGLRPHPARDGRAGLRRRWLLPDV